MSDRLRDSRVLVTGASGFLGSAMIRALRERGARLRLVARRVPDSSEPDCEWLARDLADDPDWPALLEGVELILHLAGQTSVRVAEHEPEVDARINAGAMLGLLATARTLAKPPTVLMAGTETIAGVHHGRLDDAIVDAPVTAYDTHKQIAERALTEAVAGGWIRGGSLRLTTLYGPGPQPRANDRGVVGQMIQRALAGQPLTVYGSGEQQRDFLFVDDAVAAFLAASERPEQLAGEPHVVGSGHGSTIVAAFEQIAAAVEQACGIRASVVHVPSPADASVIDTRSVVADSSRFSARTGWTPDVDFSEGLRRTIAWRLRS